MPEKNVFPNIAAMQNRCHSNRGFTLMEIAIVLTIIGFLIGGVIAGRVMIRQSQVNSVMTDVQKYKAATIQFQQKYGYLPGDFPNATNYWGTPTLGCPMQYSDSTGYSTTCNGNGDGKICNASNGNYTALGQSGCMEMLLAWQHLNLAHIIDGRFKPSMTSAGYESINYNIPAAKIENTGFNIAYLGTNPSSVSYFNASYGHVIMFGVQSSDIIQNYTNLALFPALSTSEALGLDTKYDDGMPSTGLIMSLIGTDTVYSNRCATTSGTPTYIASSNNTPECALIFLMQDF
jgi:prepilin-type N-terminal cleavage/methylation domain-containing protein